MLAIDRCTTLTFRFLVASWQKIHLHVVEFSPFSCPLKFVPQTAYLSSEVNKYTAELSFGSSRFTLSRRAH